MLLLRTEYIAYKVSKSFALQNNNVYFKYGLKNSYKVMLKWIHLKLKLSQLLPSVIKTILIHENSHLKNNMHMKDNIQASYKC